MSEDMNDSSPLLEKAKNLGVSVVGMYVRWFILYRA